MKKLLIGLTILSLLSCGNQKNDDPVLGKNDNAQWISDGRILPEKDSLFYLDMPAPVFRKKFITTENIQSAKLLITAAGYYKASMNGTAIGDYVLDPAWTDYSKRIFYSEYDVTDLMNTGANALGVELGNGFFNPLPMRKWGRRNMREDLNAVGNPVFIARLIINYENGKTEEVVSDNTWKYTYGPIIRNDIYLGVVYDARKELDGWNEPEYDDSSWKTATVGESPGGDLQKTFFPHVRITKKIEPVKIYSPENGVYIVDMGVNFTGTFKIRLSGDEGDTVKFRFGERIYDDGGLNPMTAVAGQIKRKGVGGPGAPEVAWQTDSYIINKDGEGWFVPDFTYHTYRYMEIVGLDYKPAISDVTGYFFHSDVDEHGYFSSSSELFNSIQDATLRTFKANLVSVQSDCPAREKFGYGGDLNAISESYIYNYDMQSFYRKTVYDWKDAMKDSTFVDTAPYVGVQYCGISWESAFLITQYYLYLYYNDIDIIKELYELDLEWMDKVAFLHPEGIVDKGLSDHGSMEPVPVQLIGTSHYLQCARIMETFASVMGDTENEKKYEALAERLKGLIKAEFWDKPVQQKINRQTLFSTLLYHEIIPTEEINAAADSLLKAVNNGPSGHFNTGIFGTKYVLETLSEHVSVEKVFKIANSVEYPGWGFMIDRGATTIWETWKESDNTFSNCHPMLGTVTEWYYRWLGGIRPIHEKPGFEEFLLTPYTPEGLSYINCSYQSPLGKIVSNWEKEDQNTYRYEMQIPEGSTANVILPSYESQTIMIERKESAIDPTKIKGLQTGTFKLEAGNYMLTVTTKK